MEWTGERISELAPRTAGACILNGQLITRDSEHWTSIPPNGGSLIFIESHGDPASIGVAVLAASAYITTHSLVAAAIVGAIGFLASKFLAPSMAGLNQMSKGRESSRTYGFDAIQNGMTNGATIPVVYGTHKVGGQIVQAYRSEGANRSQELRMLIALSEGPLESIGVLTDGSSQYTTAQDNLTGNNCPVGMTINGVEASTYKDIKVSLRMGGQDTTDSGAQRPIPGFEQCVTEYSQAFRLATDKATGNTGIVFSWKTRAKVNAVEANIAFPDGLFITNETGDTNKMTVKVRMEIWNEAGTTRKQSRIFEIKEAKRGTPVYWTCRIEGLSPAIYTVKISRYSPNPETYLKKSTSVRIDKMDLIGINEIVNAQLAYPGVALLSLQVRANDQLSGQTPTVLAMVKGKKVAHRYYDIVSMDIGIKGVWVRTPNYDPARYPTGEMFVIAENSDSATNNIYTIASTQASGTDTLVVLNEALPATAVASGYGALYDWTQSPAYIAQDILTNKRYGLGGHVAVADIDQSSLEEFRAFCAESIPKYTSSPSNETRFLFDGVFDAAAAGWESLLQVCATARCVPVKLGNRIKFKLERQKTMTQVFTVADMKKGSLNITYVNPEERKNVIELSFLNASKNFEQDQVTESAEGLDENSMSVRKDPVTMYGVTRDTQARRQAAYLLRSEQYTMKLISFESGLDAIGCEVGDVIGISHDVPEWGASGRIASLEAGTDAILLDRAHYYEGNVIYSILEVDNDAESDDGSHISIRDFVYASPGFTAYLPLTPAFGTSGAIGRQYVIGRKFSLLQKAIVTKIGSATNGLFRKIESLQYVSEVYTDDADPLSDVVFNSASYPIIGVNRSSDAGDDYWLVKGNQVTRFNVAGAKMLVSSNDEASNGSYTIASAALSGSDTRIYVNAAVRSIPSTANTEGYLDLDNPVTNLAVTETLPSAADGISDLTISWTGIATATQYEVWYQPAGSGGGWISAGDPVAHPATSMALKLDYPFGATVDVAVQTVIATAGYKNPLPATRPPLAGDAPNVEYTIKRIDGGKTEGVIPANIAGLQWNAQDATTYTLQWTAITGAYYSVHLGNFNGGLILKNRASGNSLSGIKVNRITRYFYVAAYKDGFFSSKPMRTYPTVGGPAGYTTATVPETDCNFADENAELTNCDVRLWRRNPLGIALEQADAAAEMEFLSQVFDCGSQAYTHVSLHAVVAAAYLGSANSHDVYGSMKHIGPYGYHVDNYLTWTLTLETSNNNEDWAAAGYGTTALLNSNVIVNRRYFRVRFKGSVNLILKVRYASIILERLVIALYRQ